MARDGILLGALSFTMSLVAALVSLGSAPAEAARKRNETQLGSGVMENAYCGLWVTADGHIRHELLPGGRYVEARGSKEAAYQGR
jgi:hypothetical protein